MRCIAKKMEHHGRNYCAPTIVFLQEVFTPLSLSLRPLQEKAKRRTQGYPTQKPETLLERIISASSAVGMYEHRLMGRHDARIQSVTIADIVEQDKRLDIPMSLEVLRKAESENTDTQTMLLLDE
jgi:hypothetical protein